MASIHIAPTRDLDVVTLHEILRLRQAVFVVEQECPYPDIDGRDLEPRTVQFWARADVPSATGSGGPTQSPAHPGLGSGLVDATLRVLREPDGTERIGRVATARHARSAGLAGSLMRAAITECRSGRIAIDAQAYLQDWYAHFGFERSGNDFVEDGIPHVPMTLG